MCVVFLVLCGKTVSVYDAVLQCIVLVCVACSRNAQAAVFLVLMCVSPVVQRVSERGAVLVLQQ